MCTYFRVKRHTKRRTQAICHVGTIQMESNRGAAQSASRQIQRNFFEEMLQRVMQSS